MINLKVALLGKISDEKVQKIKDMGFDVDVLDKSILQSGNYSRDYDILCGSVLFSEVDIKEFKNLKYILLFSQGVDYMPLDYIREEGIVMANNKAAFVEPIGEFIVFAMLELAKNARLNIKNQNENSWKPRSTMGTLYNKKIMFLGTGDIAVEGAKRLQGFDMKITGYNTNGRDIEYFDYCVDKKNLKTELSEADYVVMTLPLTDKTFHFLDKDGFDAMKQGAAFINIARGDVVNEKDLIENLKSGKISGAVLDVFEHEPLEKESPLWNMDNVYITPHISAASEDIEERIMRNVITNLENLSKDKKLVNIIDLKKKY